MVLGSNVSVDTLVEGLLFMASGQGASSPHVDGHGVAWLEKGRVHSHKSVCSILEDGNLEQYYWLNPSLVALHARKAVKGVKSRELTHPFRIGDYAVFHNTWFTRGDSDPLRLVRHLEGYLVAGREAEGVSRALMSLDNFLGANCILVGPELAVVGVRYADSPKSEYYEMALSDGNGVIVSSEQFPGRGWKPLTDSSVVSVRPDGSYKVEGMRSFL